MRSFLLVALLTCAAFCAGAQEPPAAPSSQFVAGAAVRDSRTPVLPADPAGQEFAFLALRLPLRSLANEPPTAMENRYLISPLISSVGRQKPRKVLDRTFLLMMGAGTALTVLDFEMTQSCLGRHVCMEANPLVPTSRAGMYATNIPFNAALYYWSYRRKASGKRFWWVAPLAIIGSHAVGAASNVPFIGKKTAP